MASVNKSKRRRKCVTCKSWTAVSRDNCRRCLRKHNDDMAADPTAEARLIAQGLLAPMKKLGRPRKKKSRKLATVK